MLFSAILISLLNLSSFGTFVTADFSITAGYPPLQCPVIQDVFTQGICNDLSPYLYTYDYTKLCSLQIVNAQTLRDLKRRYGTSGQETIETVIESFESRNSQHIILLWDGPYQRFLLYGSRHYTAETLDLLLRDDGVSYQGWKPSRLPFRSSEGDFYIKLEALKYSYLFGTDRSVKGLMDFGTIWLRR